MPQWISAKNWHIYPFLPVIITLAVQLLSYWLTSNLIGRAREELETAGIEGAPQHTAIHIGESLALILGMYGGLLPVVGALTIAVLSRPPLDPIAITIIYGVLAIVAFLLIPFMISIRLSDLSVPFSDQLRLRRDRALKKLGFSSYGAFINVLLIFITSGILFYIAYLELPPRIIQNVPSFPP